MDMSPPEDETLSSMYKTQFFEDSEVKTNKEKICMKKTYNTNINIEDNNPTIFYNKLFKY